MFEEIRIKGSVKISVLMKLFDASESTIRRDLEDLEKQGFIKRVHGGAILREHVSVEPSNLDKSILFAEEKERIGKYAASIIEEKTSIIIDAGTTTAYLAQHLQTPNIKIITNGINIAEILSAKYNTMLTGGLLKPNTHSMVGEYAIQMLAGFHVDICFLAINAISEDYGLTTPDSQEAWVKKEMINAAEKVILLADSSKFGKVTLSRVGELKNVDMLITDDGISDEDLHWLRSHNINVCVV